MRLGQERLLLKALVAGAARAQGRVARDERRLTEVAAGPRRKQDSAASRGEWPGQRERPAVVRTDMAIPRV